MKELGVVFNVAEGISIWGILVGEGVFPVVVQMGAGVFHLIVLPLEWLISRGLVLLIGTLIRYLFCFLFVLFAKLL